MSPSLNKEYCIVLEEVLNPSMHSGWASQTNNPQLANPPYNMKAKLPKLQVKKFNIRLQDWQKFWDSFQSSIDRNNNLFAVNKFSYLKSLVQERVRSTIEGIVLTAVNSDTPVQALKKQWKGHSNPVSICNGFTQPATSLRCSRQCSPEEVAWWVQVEFQGIEGPQSQRKHVFDDSCSRNCWRALDWRSQQGKNF